MIDERADVEGRLESLEREVEKLGARLRATEREKKIYDARFLALAAAVRAHERTFLNNGRLWILWQGVRNAAPLGGAAAEVGTYRGGSAYFIASAFLAARGSEAPFEVVDTFEGHPADAVSDVDTPEHRERDKFKQTSLEEVRGYLAEFQELTVHKGAIGDVAPTLPEREYAFVHVDVDIYEPVRDCLEYFAPRLQRGGVIVLDDYTSPRCPGVRQAAEEFDAAREQFQAWHPHTQQLVLIKR